MVEANPSSFDFDDMDFDEIEASLNNVLNNSDQL